MPKNQKPDGVIADSTKRLASRFYQLKTGHARTGQCLHWAKVHPDAQCWWCKFPSQTRDHLFKVCPEWKMQQKVLWAEVQKETGRWKSRWKIRDLLADRRCRQAEELDLREDRAPRRNGRCSFPRRPSWRPRETRSRGEMCAFPLSITLA